MAYIKRAISEVLKQRAEASKVLLLTGARQVGKSTVLNHEFQNHNKVTFDNRQERLAARGDATLFFMNNEPPLIIDEVQKEPSILEDIKMLVDETDARGRFILSGSQSLSLAKGASESLAGRVSVLNLAGLSMREIKGVEFNKPFVPNEAYIKAREQYLASYSNIWDVIFKGSFPEMYASERTWEDFYSSYVNTYIERDVNELIATDGVTFTKFMCVLAARTGELLNYANVAREVEVSLPTIKTWVSILQRCGIIYLLAPFYQNTVKRAVKTPKVYFADTGLACYLAGWTQQSALMRSVVAGNMFETFCVSEIVKSFQNAGKSFKNRIFFYRGKHGGASSENEIDLVIEENGVLYPVEIKMTSKPLAKMAAANTALEGIKNKSVATGIILCLCPKKTYLSKNVLALPVSYV